MQSIQRSLDTMQSITPAQHTHIITLSDAGTSGEKISCLTGVSPSTISRIHSQFHSELPKSFGGHPSSSLLLISAMLSALFVWAKLIMQ